MNTYVALHNHSQGSFLDGFSSVEQMAARAKSVGMKAIALTDHGECNQHWAFQKACDDAGVKPIFGCLLEGQEIMTIDGVKPVESIAEGDLVLTHKGRFRRVVRTMSRDYEGVGYEILLNKNYSRTLILTEEHPILVRLKDGSIEWLKPGDIPVTDGPCWGAAKWDSYVCLPKIGGSTQTIDMMSLLPGGDGFYESEDGRIARTYSNRYSKDHVWDVSAHLDVDYDLAYLMGIYAAEGSFITRSGGAMTGGVVMSHNVIDRWITEKIDNILCKFGCKYNRKVRVRDIGRSLDGNFTSLPLAYLLLDQVGKGAKNKRVPPVIWKSPRSVRQGFIDGLLDGDGKTPTLESNKDGRLDLKVTSPHLAWGLRTMLADLGHFVGVTRRDGRPHSDTYMVSYSPNRKYSRGVEDEDYSFRPIKDIRKVEISQTVYNFEVEEDNSYVSDFVLHNCEGYLVDDIAKTRETKSKVNSHLCMWAETDKGLSNLWKISSLAYIDGFYYRPLADWKMLRGNTEGIIASDGCMLSNTARFILADDLDSARMWLGRFLDAFGEDNFFMELHTWQFVDPKTDKERSLNADMTKINQGKVRLSKEMGIPLIVVNDAHYSERCDHENHALVWAMSTNADQTEGRGETAAWIMTDEEVHFWMSKHGVGREIVQEAIENTSRIADRCNARIRPTLHIPTVTSSSEGDLKAFEKDVQDGFDRKIKSMLDSGEIDDEKFFEYKDRLEYEKELIVKKKFYGYFMIIADFVRWGKSSSNVPFKKPPFLMGAARGSAGGSLVAYLLDITELDPIKYGLMFERFIDISRGTWVKHFDTDLGEIAMPSDSSVVIEGENGNREAIADDVRVGDRIVSESGSVATVEAIRELVEGGLPDIDVDVPQSKRHLFKEYLRHKYGQNNVASIGTFSTLKPKGAVKDLARALGISFADANSITKIIGKYSAADGSSTWEDILEEGGEELAPWAEKYPELFDKAGVMNGLIRQSSVHAAGMVISGEDLLGVLPLRKKNDEIVTQWEAPVVEANGFIKADLLGIRHLDSLMQYDEMVNGTVEVALEDGTTLVFSMDDELIVDGKRIPARDLMPGADLEDVVQ